MHKHYLYCFVRPSFFCAFGVFVQFISTNIFCFSFHFLVVQHVVYFLLSCVVAIDIFITLQFAFFFVLFELYVAISHFLLSVPIHV